jgi:hypothetical protein
VPQKGNDRAQLRTKRVPDLSWCRNALRHHFGTGQYDSDHWPGLNLKIIVASHGGQGDVARIQCCAGRDQNFTGHSFFACRTDVLARPRFAILCVVTELQERAAVSVLVDLAVFLAEYRLGAGRHQSACGYDDGTPGGQKGHMVGKDPGTAAVDGPAVHGRRVVMRECLEGGHIAGQDVACCRGEGDLHRRERQSAVESDLPGFGPGG